MAKAAIPEGYEVVEEAVPEGYEVITNDQYLALSNGKAVAKARDMIANFNDRRYVLDLWRNSTPEEQAEIMTLAPDVATSMRDERGGFLERTANAVYGGIARGVSQPIMELTGLGGTDEEIAALRQFKDRVAGQVAPATPDDPWYERGPLQAVEMLPWMMTIVGGGGAAKGAASALGVAGKGLRAAEIAGITGAAFPSAYADAKGELADAGVDEWWAKPAAGVIAASVGAVEGIIPNPFGGGPVPLAQGAKKAAVQYAANALKKAPFEAGEEYIQGFISGLGKAVATHLDAEAPDQGYGKAFQEAWEQGNEALLPMAFLLGAPGAVGTGLTAAQANRVTQAIQQHEAVLKKGFVSAQDGVGLGLSPEEMANRTTRQAAVEQRLEVLNSLSINTGEEKSDDEVPPEAPVQQGQPGEPTQQEKEQVQPEEAVDSTREVREEVAPGREPDVDEESPEVDEDIPNADLSSMLKGAASKKDIVPPEPAKPKKKPIRKDQQEDRPPTIQTKETPELDLARRAARGEAVERPEGISEGRWNAMVSQQAKAMGRKPPTRTQEVAPPQPVQEQVSVDENRVEELRAKKRWRKTGNQEVDASREAQLRQEVAEEAELLQKYPPGTELEIKGYQRPFRVRSDGKLIEIDTGRQVNDNAGAALLPHDKKGEITVVKKPPQKPQEAVPAEPTPKPASDVPTQQEAAQEPKKHDTGISISEVMERTGLRETAPAIQHVGLPRETDPKLHSTVAIPKNPKGVHTITKNKAKTAKVVSIWRTAGPKAGDEVLHMTLQADFGEEYNVSGREAERYKPVSEGAKAPVSEPKKPAKKTKPKATSKEETVILPTRDPDSPGGKTTYTLRDGKPVAAVSVDAEGNQTEATSEEEAFSWWESDQRFAKTAAGKKAAKALQTADEKTSPSQETEVGTDKEPWQMTQGEYFDDPGKVQADVGASGSGYRVKYKYITPPPGGPFIGETTLPDKPKKGEVISAMFGKATVTSSSKAKPAKLDNLQLLQKGRIKHREMVQDALNAGKTVPPEVLADYPDLVPAPSQETQAEAPREAEPEKATLKDRAAKAREEAKKAGEQFKKASKNKLHSNPFLDPELVASAATVTYKYAKAGVLTAAEKTYSFGEFIAELSADIGQKAVNQIKPLLEAKWRELQESGEIDGMQPIEPPTPPEEGENFPSGRAPSGTTSIKNAVVNSLRERRGVGPLPEVIPESFEEWAEAAAARMSANSTIGKSLVMEMLDPKTRRNLTNIESAILQLHYRKLNNEFLAAERELTAAVASGDSVAKSIAQTTANNLMDELYETEMATKAAGTEAGRSLVSRRMELEPDFSLGTMIAQARVANEGKPLPPETVAEIAEKSRQIEALQKALDEERAKNAEFESRQRAGATVKEMKASKPKKTGRKVQLQEKAKAAVTNFKEKWSKLFELRAVPDPKEDAKKWVEITNAAVDVIKAYAELGVYSFSELMARVKTDIGELPEKSIEAFQVAWDKEKAAGNIGTPPVNVENVLAVSREARKIARMLVENGITDIDEVIDTTHEIMKEFLPDITRRETMDAISSYGQFTPLSQEETEVILRDLKGQMQQLAKLDDMRQGRPPSKTGRQRREPSDEERRLIKEVNEEMRRMGFVVTDPAKQLKTSLQAAKTAVRNNINDMLYEMEIGDQIVRERTKLVPDEELVDLKREQEEVRQAYREMFPPPERVTTVEDRVRDAERQIERIQGELEDIKQGREKAKPDRPELPEEKRKELEMWRKRLSAAKKAAKQAALGEWESEGGSFPPPAEMQATERALDRTIKVLEEQLARREVQYEKKKQPISTPAFDAKRARIAELKALREAMRMQLGLTEERARQIYEANLQRRIADYQLMIANKQFDPKPKKEPRQLSRNELNLKRQLEDVKNDYYQLVAKHRIANLKGWERAYDIARETAHFSRAAMTSIDLSAVFRQGGAASFSHPLLAKQASAEMFQALTSQQAEFDSIEAIRNDPLGQFAQTAGLSLTDREGKATKQEEAFMGRWANQMAELDVKGAKAPLAIAGKGIAASARAYTTYLNSLRFNLFKLMVENLGKSGQVTLDEAKVIANFINNSTGRSDLGGAMKWAQGLNAVFFAPRYVVSRFNYLALPFRLPFMKTSGRVKKAIALEYARHMTGVAVFLGLLTFMCSLLSDDDDEICGVDIDPRSSDFMKFRIGETRIDPMSGLSQVVVFLSRLATGETKRSDGSVKPLRDKMTLTTMLGGEQDKRSPIDQSIPEVVGKFAWSKLAPVPGSMIDLLAGENVVGEETSPGGVAVDMIIPLSFREVKDTMVARGITEGTAISVLAILGMGTATYGPRTKYATGTEEERSEQFAKDLKRMTWNSPDPAYADFLTEPQRAEIDKRRHQKQMDAVYDGTAAPPKRQNYRSDETFEQGMERYNANLERLREMQETFSHQEARRLLDEYYLREYGKATPSYMKRVLRLRKMYR